MKATSLSHERSLRSVYFYKNWQEFTNTKLSTVSWSRSRARIGASRQRAPCGTRARTGTSRRCAPTGAKESRHGVLQTHRHNYQVRTKFMPCTIPNYHPSLLRTVMFCSPSNLGLCCHPHREQEALQPPTTWRYSNSKISIAINSGRNIIS